MQSKLCAVYCRVKQSFWNLQWKETVGDESREFGRYMRQREEQEKQEEELFTRAPVTKRDKQIEKRIRRQLHGYVQIVYLLLLLIVCVNTQLTLVSYTYYSALGLPWDFQLVLASKLHPQLISDSGNRLGGLTDGFDLGMNMLIGGDKEDDGGSSKSRGKSGNRKKQLKSSKKRKRH